MYLHPASTNPRMLVNLSQAHRYPWQEPLPNEYIMLYNEGWIYIENDQRRGRIYRYDMAGIRDSIRAALNLMLISVAEANQYHLLMNMIEFGVFFQKDFFLWNFEFDIMITLDTFIMTYANERIRVHEMPSINGFLDDDTIETISIISPCAIDQFEWDLSEDEVYIDPAEAVVMDTLHMVFDLETVATDISGFEFGY